MILGCLALPFHPAIGVILLIVAVFLPASWG
jgi:hypothetical protein